MSKEHLGTYLNDHLAGVSLTLEILDHLASETSDLSFALSTLRVEIEADRQQLATLMALLHIPESRVRKAGNWLAEQLSEAKLELDDDENGPLRRLERLETLAVGIDGNVALWRALNAAAASDKQLGSVDYELLAERGEEQRTRVEAWRLESARAALIST